jgi:hypothetical protein
MKKFKTIMMAAGAAVALLAFEPTTLLLKIAVVATGMAVGAVLADPVAQEAAEFKKAVQEMKAQMAQKPVEAEVVN